MDVRRDIEKRIEKENQKILDLQSQIGHSEAFIQGLLEASKMLPKDGEIKTKKRKGTLRAGSDMAKIQELIKQTGRPMRIGEIVVGLGKPDTKANRMSISGSLGRYVRKGDIFNRPGPNLFSIIGMESKENSGLPPEFGIEEVQK